MSDRDISGDLATALGQDKVVPILFLYGDFPDGAVRIWTGEGNLDWDGETWTGLGSLLQIDPVSESTDSAAQGLSIEVSGFTPEFFDPIMLGDYQGGDAKIWLGAFDANTDDLVEEPYLLFSGKMDSDSVVDNGKTSTVTIHVEHRLSDLLKPRSFRYTHEDQQTLYPDRGDKGLEYVASLQEVDLSWGRN